MFSINHWFWVVVVLLSTLTGGGVMVGSTNPGGVQTKLTGKAFEYFAEILREELKNEIISETVASYIDAKIGDVLDLSYDITHNIRLADVPNVTVASSKTGFSATISNIDLDVHADWSFLIHAFSENYDGHGNVDFQISSNISIGIEVGAKNGSLVVSTSNNQCENNMKIFDFKVNGAPFFYDLSNNEYIKLSKKLAEKQVCSEFEKYVNGELSKVIEDFDMVFNIDEHAYIDLSVLSAPNFSEESIQIFHKGEVLSQKDQEGFPGSATPLPPHTETSRMLYLLVTEYTFASAAYVYYKAGVLQYNITNDMVPSPFSLNTGKSPFNIILPQNGKYSNMDMVLKFEVTNSPVLNLTSGGLKCSLIGQLKCYAFLKNKDPIFLFSLSVSMSLSAFLHVNTTANAFNLSFTLDSFKLSEIKKMDKSARIVPNTENLDEMEKVLSGIIQMKLNERGAKGIPLSTDRFELLKPEISFGEGYILIGTDFKLLDVEPDIKSSDFEPASPTDAEDLDFADTYAWKDEL